MENILLLFGVIKEYIVNKKPLLADERNLYASPEDQVL
jgi:hypothetical protein